MSLLFRKNAATPENSYAMAGRLYLSQSGWILLSVPNAFVRGVFDSLDEPGLELPPGQDGRPFNAHISVIRPEEIERHIGDPDKISERGHVFHYMPGKLRTVVPGGWREMSRVYFIEVKSPELERLRVSYGLPRLPMRSGEELPLHISVAVRRVNVLRDSDVSKIALFLPARLLAG